ncbi:ABC transporter substrate-binding protein [Archaeoglobus neptunius]|uniref:ABC transporter substrate-binding protein n=1 Tax=Archaeoglobus neptunius TaxID=2798580 RepID=UPI00192569CD|nr:ABC transporter substrate-binding protein [Archaeoglobus neptunius]
MRKILPVLILLIIASTVLGCAQHREAKIKIVDQSGREVEIGKVERIVSLWPEATRVLFALGVEDKIVGLDSDSKKCPILTRAFPDRLKEIPDVGSAVRGTLSLEKLAELKPDIVFVRTEDRELADKIQQTLGIPVVCVRMDKFNPPQTSFDIITVIGKSVGKEERARKIREYLERKIEEVKSVTSKIPSAERPKVYLASPYNLNSVIALATDVEIAGGKSLSVYCKSWACSVSFEQIASWNPDVILLHAYGKFMPDDLKKDSNWQKIKAVKENRIYRILFGYTGKDPGLFVINVLTEAKILYPDKFNYDVEKEGNEIFKMLYGVDGLYTKIKEDFKLSSV